MPNVPYERMPVSIINIAETPMRITTLAGIALIVVGGFFLIRGGSFTTRREMMNVGGLRVTAEEQRPIMPWVAGLTIIAGIAVAATGVRRRA